MVEETTTYAIPLMTENVKRASDQLHSILDEKGYRQGADSPKQVTYLGSGRFIADEPTLRFATRPPLGDKDQRDITTSVSGSIDIFREARER